MIHRKKFYMRFRMSTIGPGCWKCNCCGPAPKHRDTFCRGKKRGQERAWFKRYMCKMLQVPD